MEASLKHVKTKMELDLHPSRLGDVQAGVSELLNEMLIRYDDTLDGVVLAIGKPRILSHKAQVQPYFPLCRLHLTVTLTLFSPKQGDMLTGRVIQVGPDFIGLLVLGVINASVAKSEMRSEWTWHKETAEWRSSKHPSHVIAVQSHVRFQVHSIQKTEVFFGITGHMRSKKTGEVGYLAAHAGDNKEAKTPLPNGKVHDSAKKAAQPAVKPVNESQGINGSSKKKAKHKGEEDGEQKKKRRRSEEGDEAGGKEAEKEEEVQAHKKQKRKHKDGVSEAGKDGEGDAHAAKTPASKSRAEPDSNGLGHKSDKKSEKKKKNKEAKQAG